jgi:hypothetical protein
MSDQIFNVSEPFYELPNGGRLSAAQIRMSMRLVARYLRARYGRVPARLYVGNYADPMTKPQRFSETGLAFYKALKSFNPESPVLLGEYRDPIYGVGVYRQAILLTVETFDSEGPDDENE